MPPVFLQTYDHVERALTFLLWDERDVQPVMPVIYSGKGPGKRKIGEEKPIEKPAPVQVTPPVGQHGAPASGSARQVVAPERVR